MKKIFCVFICLAMLLTLTVPAVASFGEENNLFNFFFEKNIEPLCFSPAFSSFISFATAGDDTGYRMRDSSFKESTINEIIASTDRDVITAGELDGYYDDFYVFFEGKDDDFELFESYVQNSKLSILPLPEQSEALELFPSISEYISQNFYGATYFFNLLTSLCDCYYDDNGESPVTFEDDELSLKDDVIDYIDFLENSEQFSAIYLCNIMGDAFDFVNNADADEKNEFVSFLYDNGIVNEKSIEKKDTEINSTNDTTESHSSDTSNAVTESNTNDNHTNNSDSYEKENNLSSTVSDSEQNTTEIATNSDNTDEPENDTTPVSDQKNDIEFTDVPTSHWAYNYIKALVNDGIVLGVGNSLFAPENNVKREEFAKIIVEAFAFDKTAQSSVFSDVDDNAWYAPYVMTAYANGIIKGKSETEFGSGENITRQDMCVMIVRAADQKGLLTKQSGDIDFTDANDIDDYAQDAVFILSNMRIITGFEDNSFRPKANATRAQASKIIAELIYGEK